MLLTLTLVPVLATWIFRSGARTWRNPFVEEVFNRYELGVRWTLRHTRLVILVAVGLVFELPVWQERR
jgi:multidrug efflux pump subunit AcrB